jgi:hypothetical protein
MMEKKPKKYEKPVLWIFDELENSFGDCNNTGAGNTGGVYCISTGTAATSFCQTTGSSATGDQCHGTGGLATLTCIVTGGNATANCSDGGAR